MVAILAGTKAEPIVEQLLKIPFQSLSGYKKGYSLANGLRKIFNDSTSIEVAYTKLAHWYRKIEELGFKAFNTVARSITLNYRSILNYFINRSTNASAESFNAKIKAFRSQFRDVKNIEFLDQAQKLCVN